MAIPMTPMPPAANNAPAGPRFPNEGTWPPGPYRDGGTRTTAATLFQGLAGLVSIATVVVVFQVFSLLDRDERLQLTQQEADDWVSTFESVSGLESLVSLLAFISLLTWLSRSVDNTPSLGGGIARRGPRWAIGAWFIPIVNFVMPALIIRDLVRRMSPNRTNRDWLILIWWLTYWAPLVVGIISEFVPIAGTESIREYYQWQLAAQVLSVAGYFVTLYLVRKLQQDAEYWAAQSPGRLNAAPLPPHPGSADRWR